MFAALILVISAAMMAQFVLFFWRANMLATAAEPISETLSSVQATFGQAGDVDDFDTIAAVSKMCPSVGFASAKLWPAQAYYQAVRLVSRLCSMVLPQGSPWARQEMASCSRYVAVSIDRRLASNQAYLAALRAC
ncbi:MAG TPA: hypothetical protein VGR93_01040 [Candidatus Acidoferrales bacterium]|nr:hypothetical protein [Candidatus Acidoferrales bacterium]